MKKIQTKNSTKYIPDWYSRFERPNKLPITVTNEKQK